MTLNKFRLFETTKSVEVKKITNKNIHVSYSCFVFLFFIFLNIFNALPCRARFVTNKFRTFFFISSFLDLRDECVPHAEPQPNAHSYPQGKRRWKEVKSYDSLTHFASGARAKVKFIAGGCIRASNLVYFRPGRDAARFENATLAGIKAILARASPPPDSILRFESVASHRLYDSVNSPSSECAPWTPRMPRTPTMLYSDKRRGVSTFLI